MSLAAFSFLTLAVLARLLPVWDQSLSNFAPLMAIAFCGAIYVRHPAWRVAPLAGLALTDLYLNWFYASDYGWHWDAAGFLTRLGCFGLALALGAWVARRKSWLWLLNGSLLGAVLFYLITNTQSWFTDPYYAKSLAGWWQALTTGHPEFPPTYLFFRNTLFGDLMFTGFFAGAMEWLARRRGEPSLLDPDEETDPAEDESEGQPAAKPVSPTQE